MQLIEKHDWREPRRTYTVAEATQRQLWDQREDRIDELRASLEKTHEFLGKLLQKLNDNGILGSRTVLSLLTAFEEVEPHVKQEKDHAKQKDD